MMADGVINLRLNIDLIGSLGEGSHSSPKTQRDFIQKMGINYSFDRLEICINHMERPQWHGTCR